MSEGPKRADTGTLRAAGAPLDATDHAQDELRKVVTLVLVEYGSRVDLPPDFAGLVARAVSIRARQLLLSHGSTYWFAGRNYDVVPADLDAPTRRITEEFEKIK